MLFAHLWRANQIPKEGSSSSKTDTLQNKQWGFWFGVVPGKEGGERSLPKHGVFINSSIKYGE